MNDLQARFERFAAQSLDSGVWQKDAYPPDPSPGVAEIADEVCVLAGLSTLGAACMLPAAFGCHARLIIERTGQCWPGGPRRRSLVIEGVTAWPSDPAGKTALAQLVRKALLEAQARDDLDMARHRLLMSLRRRGHAV